MLHKKIEYKLYYSIITKFFYILLRDISQRGREVQLPGTMGSVCLETVVQKRAFHYRVDNNATEKNKKTVFYKVPILNDYYTKLIWNRPKKYKTCKLIPLGYSKKIINQN